MNRQESGINQKRNKSSFQRMNNLIKIQKEIDAEDQECMPQEREYQPGPDVMWYEQIYDELGIL